MEPDYQLDNSVRRMKLGHFIIALLILMTAVLPVTAFGDDDNLKVLFLGNSLTAYHELPTIIERMASAAVVERPLRATRIAPGGETFYRHSERRGEDAPLTVIASGDWDVVVLQENGRVAARGEGESFTFAARLVRTVRTAGAEPLFYMTWAYRDRPETHATILRTYDLLGSRLEVPVAPVGEAWRRSRETAPDIELFDADGIHPSPEGSYLAACVIFSLLYDRNPVGIPAATPDGVPVLEIDLDVARRLQEIAWRSVESYQQPHHSP